jgi:membrane-bound lytic murein transglycosylase MltF
VKAVLISLILLWIGCVAGEEQQSEPPTLPLPMEEPWVGDLGGMLERRYIRFLVSYNKLFYFLDGATQRGGSYELGKLFEKELNGKLGNPVTKVNVVFIPVPRDRLVPWLLEGRGDIAGGHLAITSERLAQVDFSIPLMAEIREVVVTGPHGPPLERLEDLSGKRVVYRIESSYEESLEQLNQQFRHQGLAPMKLVPVAPFLEDGDILEMVNTGFFPITVVDSHKAAFWSQVLTDLTVYEDLVVHDGGKVGWAFRKGSPHLAAAVNEFVRGHRKGTLYGNILFKRYIEDNRWVRNSLARTELNKLRKLVPLFKKYAASYELDWLMLAALAYQESGLNQNKRSPRGAVGVMQLLPSTAADPSVDIPDITTADGNIHAGAKYLRFLYDRYLAESAMDPMDKMLFAIAAYNAGPAKVARLRVRTQQMGLDPTEWFHNVEVAAARHLGAETVQYVSNVYKYYTAYRLGMERLVLKD